MNVSQTDPPEVTCQSVYIVHINTSLQIRCHIDAFPLPPLITWSKKETGKVVKNGPGNYFDIAKTGITDEGIYICTATNLMVDFNNRSQGGTGSCMMNVTVVCEYK